MKNKIFILCLGLFLISLASATTIYSGETIYYDFTNEVDVIQEITWEVVNNTYNLEGLNITTNLTGATVSLDPLFKPDNFTIIFMITGQNIQADVSVPRGRGSSCKYNKNFDWNCSEWGKCVNGTQIRICKDYNNCGGTYGKPNETQNCSIEKIEEDQEEDTEEEPAETEKDKFIWIYVLCGILILAIIFMWYRILKKSKKEKTKEQK